MLGVHKTVARLRYHCLSDEACGKGYMSPMKE